MSSDNLMIEICLDSRGVLAFNDLVQKKLFDDNKQEILNKEENRNCQPCWLRIKQRHMTMMLFFVEVDKGQIEIVDWEEQDSAVNSVGYGQNLQNSRFESLLKVEDDDRQEN